MVCRGRNKRQRKRKLNETLQNSKRFKIEDSDFIGVTENADINLYKDRLISLLRDRKNSSITVKEIHGVDSVSKLRKIENRLHTENEMVDFVDKWLRIISMGYHALMCVARNVLTNNQTSNYTDIFIKKTYFDDIEIFERKQQQLKDELCKIFYIINEEKTLKRNEEDIETPATKQELLKTLTINIADMCSQALFGITMSNLMECVGVFEEPVESDEPEKKSPLGTLMNIIRMFTNDKSADNGKGPDGGGIGKIIGELIGGTGSNPLGMLGNLMQSFV